MHSLPVQYWMSAENYPRLLNLTERLHQPPVPTQSYSHTPLRTVTY